MVVPLGKALSGIPHLGVVHRWPATLKRARVTLWSRSRDRGINMQLNSKKCLKLSDNLLFIGCG